MKYIKWWLQQTVLYIIIYFPIFYILFDNIFNYFIIYFVFQRFYSLLNRKNDINIIILLLANYWPAINLQLLHPKIAEGVNHHSKNINIFNKRRILRTFIYLDIAFYGLPYEKEKSIKWLNKIHFKVKGNIKDKTLNFKDKEEYSFSNDLQLWVLSTIVYVIVKFNDNYYISLSDIEKDLLVTECLMIGHKLGTPYEKIPKTYKEFEIWFVNEFSKLEYTFTSIKLLNLINKVSPYYIRLFFPLNYDILQPLLKNNNENLLLNKYIIIIFVRLIYSLIPKISIRSLILILCIGDKNSIKVLNQTLKEIETISWFDEKILNNPSYLDIIIINLYEKNFINVFFKILLFPIFSIKNTLQEIFDFIKYNYLKYNLTSNKIPNHIGIIMDGNRRFAKNQKWETWIGHYHGVSKINDVLKWWLKTEIKILTLWAFSNDNFKRSNEELEKFWEMTYYQLLYLKLSCMIHVYKIKINFIGEINLLPENVQNIIKEIENITYDYDNYVLQIAMPYNGRNEIINAFKKYLVNININNFYEEINMINENVVSKYIYNNQNQISNVDLIIRTSGEYRLSGFMLWESMYCELYFCNKLWPDFTENDFFNAIVSYTNRNIRNGK
jgi:tritrans,polycis-undecaprenyl-diphosphate synthase [geranylgeranyl-diphosphate specific]